MQGTGHTPWYCLYFFHSLSYTLVSRPVIETTILRTPGLLYQENPDQTVSNVYNIKIVNKTHETLPLEFRLIAPEGEIKMAGSKLEIRDQSMFEIHLYSLSSQGPNYLRPNGG